MKIASWNVNGIRSVAKKGFVEYMQAEQPDLLFVQEVRAEREQLPQEVLQLQDYSIYWNACKIKKGYSGVAIFSKVPLDAVEYGIGIPRFDDEGRIIRADWGDISYFGVYFPNGKLGERLQYKLDFYDAFFEHCSELQAKGRKVAVCGDYNTAHKAIDLARPSQNTQTSGFLPEEREKIDAMVAKGYHDTFRLFTQEGEHYTWWSNQQRSRERNVGWRIDYHFVEEKLVPQVRRSYHRPDVFGSDHCPVILEMDV